MRSEALLDSGKKTEDRQDAIASSSETVERKDRRAKNEAGETEETGGSSCAGTDGGGRGESP